MPSFVIESDIDTSLYTIAWICCNETEYDAALLMLDKTHGDYAPRRRFCDCSWYTLGEVCGHNVALVMAFAEQDRVSQIASLSIDLELLFPNIRVSMIISVGGGIPSEEHDVRLGDVVVSTPDREYGGVVDVDGDYDRRPNALLPAVELATLAVASLLKREIRTGLGPGDTLKHLTKMKSSKPELETEYAFPGAEKDLLFPSNYECKRGRGWHSTCAEHDDTSRAIARPTRTDTDPKIHFGTVAACRRVVEYPLDRDDIKKHTSALAVQVGAEYLMQLRPLVIVGVANYGDSHSDEKWKKYAAANAAACAKDLVGRFPASR
ncbi:hypothetical protein BJX65DRAFT_307228 [Aspergillus insuetus]